MSAASVVKPPFEEIVSAYGPVVLRVVRAVVGPDDAEDAWSETFLSAMRAYPELPAGARVEAWLVTIAHRKALDVARGNARRALPVEHLPDRPGRAGRPEDAEPDLWRALRALPPRQRQAVAYHYLAGLPYKEIAALTGGSAQAARRAAADGIGNLRRAGLDGERGAPRPAEKRGHEPPCTRSTRTRASTREARQGRKEGPTL
ncbi:sigma-70 family RNA polymerase sigma factor [Streptomyces sp. NPDC049954]|uniref:RNA polymerase sigma factor n=1 Tax=Streptomyces sp. NPDC049954 TaxID=3155779 RepID=UPI00342C9E22